MATPSYLIVGLGNPGDEYLFTRHNIGFLAADAIAEKYLCPAWKKKHKALITSCDRPAVLIQKPQTYMNLSGEAVGEAMRFHKLEPKDVIVFHDDLDLLPGQVRVKKAGGTGGHNGLKSIDAHIGQEYWRVRLGIGHPGQKGDVVTNYVLGSFAKADITWLEPLLYACAKEFELLLTGSMNDYQSRVTQPLKPGATP